MGPYSGVGAYLSKWVLGEGPYSGGGGYSEVGAYLIIYDNKFIISTIKNKANKEKTCVKHIYILFSITFGGWHFWQTLTGPPKYVNNFESGMQAQDTISLLLTWLGPHFSQRTLENWKYSVDEHVEGVTFGMVTVEDDFSMEKQNIKKNITIIFITNRIYFISYST